MASTMADLPPFIAIASTRRTIELFEHASSAEDALAWCDGYKHLLAGEVEQLAIMRTHIVHLLRFGEAPVLVAVRGWRWIDACWQEVPPRTLQLVFDTFYPRRPKRS